MKYVLQVENRNENSDGQQYSLQPSWYNRKVKWTII